MCCKSKGDPEYTSFDGKQYFFSGDCEYVLVKSNYSKFLVTQTDAKCPRGRDFCPRKVTIRYESTEIVLYRKSLHKNITVDGTVVKIPYKSNGKYQNTSNSLLILKY